MGVVIRRGKEGMRFITEVPDVHEWPETWLMRHLKLGHVSMQKGEIVVHTDPGSDDEVFELVEGPGVYCCLCGDQIGDVAADATKVGPEEAQRLGDEYRGHVAACDGSDEDAGNPAGYRVTTGYVTKRKGA